MPWAGSIQPVGGIAGWAIGDPEDQPDRRQRASLSDSRGDPRF